MSDLGTDIATPSGLDLDPSFALVDGYRALGEALARRIVTRRGSLIDDPQYGTDVRARMNDNLDARGLAELSVSIVNEWKKDERVFGARVTCTLAAGTLRIVGVVQAATGAFRLVVSVDAVTASLLTVEPT
jgi:hypothetical protein